VRTVGLEVEGLMEKRRLDIDKEANSAAKALQPILVEEVSMNLATLSE
jgi:hypothetical protein